MKKYYPQMRDSLGVPLEPQEEIPMVTDYKGKDLYEGDDCYFIDGDYILFDDIREYLKDFEITIGE